jgi:hypothetical protein
MVGRRVTRRDPAGGDGGLRRAVADHRGAPVAHGAPNPPYENVPPFRRRIPDVNQPRRSGPPGGRGNIRGRVACNIERLLLLPPFAEQCWPRRPPRNSASFSAIRRRARPQAFRAPGNRDPSRRLIRQGIREPIRRPAAILRLRGGDRGAQSTSVRCPRRELLRLKRFPVHGRSNRARRRRPPMHRHKRAMKWSPSRPPRR